ncbi:hypothetical protein DVH24_005789 [Malus domestica]|uniref:HTH myb-type domain-containing protein n=1 Tax=Malus domestica TaxID=3750 RepID=A0A498IJK2_MALDO|nr:hypothetical protein DVH24_005789 [Malus domestica]
MHQHLAPSVGINTKSYVDFLSFFHLTTLHRESTETEKPNTCTVTSRPMRSLIAKRLPGRTDNDVKNYWNTKLNKKLFKMGIDPVTQKPYSQILSDYRNINGLPSTAGNHPFLSLFK